MRQLELIGRLFGVGSQGWTAVGESNFRKEGDVGFGQPNAPGRDDKAIGWERKGRKNRQKRVVRGSVRD